MKRLSLLIGFAIFYSKKEPKKRECCIARDLPVFCTRKEHYYGRSGVDIICLLEYSEVHTNFRTNMLTVEQSTKEKRDETYFYSPTIHRKSFFLHTKENTETLKIRRAFVFVIIVFLRFALDEQCKRRSDMCGDNRLIEEMLFILVSYILLSDFGN
ncbi:hypothetical protein Tcan_02364 [Toxocara canis]|uniref:Uncharacterized protein n=1 Tax=Toxocara canis TaxID=6265 RepID=A0A0B2UPN0_TOXCA|nr:hypothetical protein Tcan_02364 [Toxocara canis]